MIEHLSRLAWPLSRLDEAVELLARRLGHSTVAPGATAALDLGALRDTLAIGRALERLLSAHGLEAEPCEVTYATVGHLPAPLMLRIPGQPSEAEPAFLVVAGLHRKALTLLGIDRRWHRASGAELAVALRLPLDAVHTTDIDRLLEASSVAESRRPRVRRALLAEQLADSPVCHGWRVVAEPGGHFGRQLRRAGVARQVAALLTLHATQFALWIAAWWLVGSGALQGRTDWGWLTAWALLLATIVPLQLLTTWMQGAVALRAGRLLKERLLVGALRLDPEDIRHQGAGQLLGRVLESDAVESLAISGGLQAGLAAVEIVMAAAVLWFGAAGGVQVGALTVWTLCRRRGCGHVLSPSPAVVRVEAGDDQRPRRTHQRASHASCAGGPRPLASRGGLRPRGLPRAVVGAGPVVAHPARAGAARLDRDRARASGTHVRGG